ncbi:MAG: hypothetical protein CL917_02660 [Deltaproteobacteria bacterium]|nr:hypothetical protein [Deltaproteobacteria bacterium]
MAINKRKVLDSARRQAQKGARQKALKEYSRLLAVDPRDAKLLLEIGDLHRRWGQVTEAISHYSKVALHYREEGFDARAVAVLKQILALDSKRYESRVALAELYQRMGLDSDALVAFQAAADGYYKEGLREQAVELLQRMVSLDPGNTTSRLKVAELLVQEGLAVEAISEFNSAADELKRQGAGEEVIVVRQRALELAPEDSQTLGSLTQDLIALNDYERARTYAEKALVASREAANFELLAEIYKHQGEEALLSEVTREMAAYYRSRGDDEKARQAMQRLSGEVVFGESGMDTGLSANSSSGLMDQDSYSNDEDFPFADAEVESEDDLENVAAEAARRLSEEDFIVDHANQTDHQTQDQPEGDLHESTEEIGEALSMVVDEDDPPDFEQCLAEARVYLRYGKREEAFLCLHQLTDLEPQHPEVWQQLGRAYAEGGEMNESREAFGQALSLAQSQDSMALATEIQRELEALEGEDDLDISGAEVSFDAEGDPAESEAVVTSASHVDQGRQAADPDLVAGEVREDEPLDLLGIEIEENEPEVLLAESFQGDRVSNESSEFEKVQLDPGRESEGEALLPLTSATSSMAEAENRAFDLDWTSPPDLHLSFEGSEPTDNCHESEGADSWAGEPVEEGPAPLFHREAQKTLEHLTEDLFEFDPQSDADEEPPSDGMPFVVTGVDEKTGSQEPVQEVGFVDSLSEPDDSTITTPLAETVELASESQSETNFSSEEGDYDLAAELAGVFEEEDPDGSQVQSFGDTTLGEGMRSLFTHFKEGVSDTLGEEDAQTRFDLAIAYREMGLFVDAAQEFEQCSKVDSHKRQSLHMWALCVLELGRAEEAVGLIEQSIALPNMSSSEEAALRFDLGRVRSQLGDTEAARASFDIVATIDPNFPGLAQALIDPASAKVTGSGNEAYESFDDLFFDSDSQGCTPVGDNATGAEEKSVSRRRKKISFI